MCRHVAGAAVSSAVLLALATTSAFAAAGDLDSSFSRDGRQITNFDPAPFASSELGQDVAVQEDGKAVVAGRHVVRGDEDFALTRYRRDGKLDRSFSKDGKRLTDFGRDDRGYATAIQDDGRIVVAGETIRAPRGNDFAIARYKPDGRLDASFSGDGKRITHLGGIDIARGIAIQDDGRIVAVGRRDGDFAIARYNSDGSLDSSFSGDGKQTTDFGGTDDFADAVALQDDGRIVVAGTGGDAAQGHTNLDFALARYNSNGRRDSSFSGDGKQTTDFGADDYANGVALRGGEIIVAGDTGQIFPSRNRDFAVARYDATGSLDPSFSDNGKRITNFGGNDFGFDVALQSSGRVAIAGQTDAGPGYSDFALLRYTSDGGLDSSFGNDGKVRTDFGGADGATGLAIADGRMVAAGEGRAGLRGGPDFAVARYLGFKG